MLALLLSMLAAQAGAETAVQVRVGSPSLELGFLFTDYYGLSPERTRSCALVLDEDDLLVALHLERASGVDFEIIARWRRDGASWDDITRRCRRDCGVYYVALPADARLGPPYGRAHGYWRKHPKGDLRLSDDEIHSLVLLSALSEHSGLAPLEVARGRARGESPKEISAHRHREDTAPAARSDNAGQHSGKAKGKNAGHGKGKGKD
jgi:hypothetical protein